MAIKMMLVLFCMISILQVGCSKSPREAAIEKICKETIPLTAEDILIHRFKTGESEYIMIEGIFNTTFKPISAGVVARSFEEYPSSNILIDKDDVKNFKQKITTECLKNGPPGVTQQELNAYLADLNHP